MPSYEFRCKDCGQEFSLFYRSTNAYAAAVPQCPHCQGESLDRLIRQVAVQAMTRDYSRMSSKEMLSVLESGNSNQVNEMYSQVKGTNPADVAPINEKLKRPDSE